MTDQLIMILSELKQLFQDWEKQLIPTEQELIDGLKKLNERLTEELPKQKIPAVGEEK